MMAKKIIIMLAVLPVLALLAYGLTLDPRAISSPMVGREAPPVNLKLFDGHTFALDEHSGEVVVINVWSSWCMPACYNEAPILEAAWQRYRSQGVVFLGVNYQDRETAAREFLSRFRYTFPNGPDVGSRVAIAYGVRGVPETFFIGRNGRIAYRHVGEISLPMLVQQIEQLLHASGGTT